MREEKTQDFPAIWRRTGCVAMVLVLNVCPLPKWITHNQEEIVNSPTWCTMFRHAGRLTLTISPHLLLATCDSDKIAIKICTSCAALHNYCKLLPTHCMSISPGQSTRLLILIKALKGKVTKFPQFSPNPSYLVENK